MVGAGADEAALLMRGEVDVVRLEVVVNDDDPVVLQIVIKLCALHDAGQFGRGDVLPAPGQVLEDELGQRKHDLVSAVADFGVAATERSKRAKLER